ncbi:MAG: MgtC/SapB family protein [Bacteroidetes bacterium]|nr:MgtC/SapB family protein [Bacteroidota bacterium]
MYSELFSEPLLTFYRLAVAAGVGMLIGFQREFAFRIEGEESKGEFLFGGVRTLTLMGILGFMLAATGDAVQQTYLVPAAVLVIGALISVSYFYSSRNGQHGLTSEVAGVLVLILGIYSYEGSILVVAATGVAAAAVLASKEKTRGFVNRLTETDIQAFVIFSVLAVIFLPLLPHAGPTTEPFTVLKPFRIGLMIVLISGVNFLGYVMTKIFGPGRGIGIAGAVGGLVSSTAVTLSLGRRSKVSPHLARHLAIGIVVSWSIMFVRMILEISAINPSLLPSVVPPLVAAGVASLLYGLVLYFRESADAVVDSTQYRNPMDLTPALTFGALFAVVLLIANAAHLYLGNAGLYASAVVSGVADVDAITLSMSELSRDSLSASVATTAIVLAAATNTIVKGIIAAAVGGKEIRRIILPGAVLIAAATVAPILVW